MIFLKNARVPARQTDQHATATPGKGRGKGKGKRGLEGVDDSAASGAPANKKPRKSSGGCGDVQLDSK